MPYLLTGDFVECCDCFTICPCWVNEIPDEDHCSGLYLWSLGPGSRIGDVDVAGMQVAAASFHAVRAGGQAMFFIDAGNRNAQETSRIEHLLYDVFSGRLGTGLKALSKLLGTNLGYRPARITSTFAGSNFDVDVTVGGQSIARAAGKDNVVPGSACPTTLKDTALTEALGIGSRAVTVQRMGDLTMDVVALPGGPLNFRGRSGMRSRFTYDSTRATAAAPGPGDEEA